MLFLGKEMATQADSDKVDPDEYLTFLSYIWKCMYFKEADISALKVVRSDTAPKKPTETTAAKPIPVRTQVARVFLKRMGLYKEKIMNCAHILCGVNDNSLDTLRPYWVDEHSPNVFSPLHICAQMIQHEVFSPPFLRLLFSHSSPLLVLANSDGDAFQRLTSRNRN